MNWGEIVIEAEQPKLADTIRLAEVSTETEKSEIFMLMATQRNRSVSTPLLGLPGFFTLGLHVLSCVFKELEKSTCKSV